jgi:Ni,Fe-hydrogenase III component G
MEGNADALAARQESMIGELREAIGDGIAEAAVVRLRRVVVTVAAGSLRDAVSFMKDHWGLSHVSMVTGRDAGEGLEVLYHFFVDGVTVTLRVSVPREAPEVPSITDLVPGANFYERELYDLLGIRAAGHPGLKRLVLPEDWPDGVFPLRKDWQPPEGGETT